MMLSVILHGVVRSGSGSRGSGTSIGKASRDEMFTTVRCLFFVSQVLTPLTISTPQPGIYVVDMGQNFAGRIALRITKDQQVEEGVDT